jgi:hypothetical protein
VVALELLAVNTRNSGVGRVLRDQCLWTSFGNGRVVKKTSVSIRADIPKLSRRFGFGLHLDNNNPTTGR